MASDNGVIHKYNPLNGNKIGVVNFKGGAASNLAISNSTLYVITKTGYLNAFK